jgi:hypothetical protein
MANEEHKFPFLGVIEMLKVVWRSISISLPAPQTDCIITEVIQKRVRRIKIKLVINCN